MMTQLNLLAAAWWDWMAAMFWQVSLLILIIAVIDMLIGKWIWPQVRYALWLLVLVKLVIPPDWALPSSVFTHFRPAIEDRVVSELGLAKRSPEPKPLPAPTSTEKTISEPQRTSPFSPAQSIELPMVSDSRETLSWKALVMSMWFAGIIIFLAILLVKIKRLRHWHSLQRDKAIPQWFHELLVQTSMRLKLQRLPAIVFSKEAVTPAVYGMFRPVMLLPANYFENLSPEAAEHVLLHELAHLKRGDLWLHGLCLLLQIAYWFNPLLIYVHRQMKHVREICCDLTVANVLQEKTMAYRQTLLNTARELLTENVEPGLGLLGVFEEPFRLISRLKWLEKQTWKNRSLMITSAFAVSIVVLLCLLPMAGTKQASLAAPMFRPAAETVLEHFEIPIAGEREFQVTIKQIPALYAAILPMRGDYDQVEIAVRELQSKFEAQGLQATGHPFSRFWSDMEKVPEQRLSWEVGFPIAAGTKVALPLELIKVTEQQVASVVIDSIPSETIWKDFLTKITDRGYVPAFPPAVELYRGAEEGKEFWRRSEMQIPIVRADESYPGLTMTIKDTKPFKAVILPGYGYFNSQIENGLKRLRQYMQEEGIKAAGSPFGRFYSSAAETPLEECYWEIGFPVKEEVAVASPFELKEFEGNKVVSATCRGPFNAEYPWSPLIVKMILHGNIPQPPGIEIWNGDVENLDSGKFETELQIGVLLNYKELGENSGEAGTDFGKSAAVLRETIVKSRYLLDKTRSLLSEWGEKIAENALENPPPDSQTHFVVGEKEVAGFHAVVLPMRGSFEQIYPAMHRLQSWLQSHEIEPTGPSFIRQMSEARIEKPEFDFIWEVGYPVPADTKVGPPFEKRDFDSMLVCFVKLSGKFDEDGLNLDLAKWMWHNRSRASGAALIYCPDKLFQGSHSTAEIHLPITKLDQPYPEVAVSTTTRGATAALVLPMSGAWKQEPQALEKLQSYVKKNNISSTGKPFIRYFSNHEVVPEEEYLWEIGIPVSEGVHAKAPFEVKYFPQQRIVSSVVEFVNDNDFLIRCYSFAMHAMLQGQLGNGYPFVVLQDESLEKGKRREICMPYRERQFTQSELPRFY